MEALGLLLHGFSVLLTFKTLAFMIVGLVLGIFVGVLPGLGGPNGVAILLPLTFTMDPTTAIVMLSLLITQLCLGFTAFLTRVAWGRNAVQPEMPMVASTVAHVAVGALLLATTVVLAVQVWRHVPVAFAERVPQAQQNASAA